MIKHLLLILSLLIVAATGISAQETSAKPADDTSASASEAPKKRGPIFRPTKDQILQVQKILKTKKLYTGDADGKYNDETREGIKSFQKDNGLKTTGTLNRATLEKFGVELTDKQKEIPVSPNSFATGTESTASTSTKTASTTGGSDTSSAGVVKRSPIFKATADQITAAQKLLKKNGMYAGEETGKLSDETREGLKRFQESKKLKVTGTLNAITLEAMGIPLTDKQKENASQ